MVLCVSVVTLGERGGVVCECGHVRVSVVTPSGYLTSHCPPRLLVALLQQVTVPPGGSPTHPVRVRASCHLTEVPLGEDGQKRPSEATLLTPPPPYPLTKPGENPDREPWHSCSPGRRGVGMPPCSPHSGREEAAGRWLSFEGRKNILGPYNHSTTWFNNANREELFHVQGQEGQR